MKGKKTVTRAVTRVITGILIGCIVIVLAGCGKTAIDANDLAMQDKVDATTNKCWEAQKPVYTGLEPDTVALLEMSRNNNTAIMTIVGKSPCNKTTAFDVQIVEVQEKNKVVGKAVGVGGDVIKMGLGVYGATEIAGSIADSAGIKVNGDGNGTTLGTDQAKVTGSGGAYVDKSGSANSKSNVDSTFTSEEDSRNTTTTDTDTNTTF